jgi:hypothetical protein
MTRAALLAFCALSLAGCEFARTSVPYGAGQGTASAEWDAARLACASEGRVPVEQYQWAVVRREAALRCELPGEMMPGGAAANH